MPGNNRIQSVTRAVRVLYAVAGAEDGRSVAQIAAAVGLRPNTTYKFIRTLEEEHLLVRRGDPVRFMVGHALTELKALDDSRHLLSVAGPVMVRRQAQDPSINFSLVELEGMDAYSRLQVLASRPGVLQRLREFRLHSFAKASSILFLAYGGEEFERQFFVAHPFSKQGAKYWKGMRTLRAFLESVRRRGYALPDFPDEGMYRVAVPIFVPESPVTAALGGYLPETTSERSKKRMVRLTIETAREISQTL